MNYLIYALFLVVVCILGYGYFIWHGISLSQRKSQLLIASAHPYTQTPANASSHILVAGDSTGVGVGAEAGESVAGRLGLMYRNASIENVSVSGLRVEGLLEILSAHISATSTYDVILLMIGANDTVGFTSKEELRTHLSEVFALTSAHGRAVYVMTSGDVGDVPIFRFPLSSLFTSRTRMVRSVFMDESKKYSSITYVDLFAPEVNEAFKKDALRFYAKDFFHPSGEGYGLWFSKLREAILLKNQ